MGMYDKVLIKCPACGELFEEQSRMGECLFNTYSLNNLPIEVAEDLLESKIYCPNCGSRIMFVKKERVVLIPYSESS